MKYKFYLLFEDIIFVNYFKENLVRIENGNVYLLFNKFSNRGLVKKMFIFKKMVIKL